MRHLLEPRVETALEQEKVIAAALARPQEARIRHHQGGSEIASEVTPEQPFGGAICQGRARHQRIDFSNRFEVGEQIGHLKTA